VCATCAAWLAQRQWASVANWVRFASSASGPARCSAPAAASAAHVVVVVVVVVVVAAAAAALVALVAPLLHWAALL